jgi:predicted ATPase
MVEKGSQFIIASPSPILLGIPGADIISFDDGVMGCCNYEEMESY